MRIKRPGRTVHGRPSTVASLNSCPTVKVMWVVRTVVDVLMDSVSPSCVISTSGLEAAFTAIMRSITFTPATVRGEEPSREGAYVHACVCARVCTCVHVLTTQVEGWQPSLALARACPIIMTEDTFKNHMTEVCLSKPMTP